MRAAVYLRQSLDRAEGIERQRTRTMALAAARDWTVVATFEDNDVSASKPRGAQTSWGRMLAALDRDEFQVVIAVDLDRLLRTTRDLNTLIDHRAQVVTVDGELDLSTADGEFRATMLAGIARFEVRRKSERQKRANSDRAAKGEWVGGRRPFGYQADGLTLEPTEAAAVRQGYADLLAGISLGSIARTWNEAGFTTGQTRQARSGHAGEPSPWRRDSVRAVLLNPRYMGAVRHRGEIVSRDAAWPAIVDESTFLAAESMLRNPSRRLGKPSGRRLLSGLARCGVCSATVHAGGAWKAGVANYRCSASTGHFARTAEPVEDYVSEVVIARLSRDDARDLLSDADRPDVEALRTEALGIRERLDAIAVDYADGHVLRAQLTAATARLRMRLEVVELQLGDAGRVDVLGPLVSADDVREAWGELDVERRRAIVETLLEVTIYPPGRGTRTFRPESVGIRWTAG